MLTSRTSCFTLLFLVATFCLAAYGMHAGDYLIFDSPVEIAQNPSLRISGAQLDDWRVAALSSDSGRLGRPLSMLSFALEYVLFGSLEPVQLKFINACLHVLTGIVLFFFLRTIALGSSLLGWSRERASAVAAVAVTMWLLHPLFVSSVLYAVQRMTLLAGLFTVAGLYLWFRQRSRWLHLTPAPLEVSRSLLLLALMTLLAGFSKENGLLLPWLVAVTELCLFRFVVAGSCSRPLRLATIGLLIAPAIGLAVFLLIDPGWVERSYAYREFDLSTRVLTQIRVLWIYLYWLAVPNPGLLGLYHDDIALATSALESTVILALLAWVVAGVSAWRYRQRWPLLGFALLWYLLAHSMESSVVALEMVFEHRNYVPYMGVLFMLASILWSGQLAYRPYRSLVCGGVILLLAASLFWRSSYWRSEIQLAEHQFQSHPDSLRSHFHLASVYQQAGLASSDPVLAQRYFNAARELAFNAWQLQPDSVPALVLLIFFDGNSDSPQRLQQWYEQLEEVLANPRLSVPDIAFLELHNNCVIAGDCAPPPQGQLAFLEQLSVLHPRQTKLRFQLVRFCFAEQDLDCAQRSAEALLEDEPGFVEALKILYAVHQLRGERQLAQQTVERILLRDGDRKLVRMLLDSSVGAGR